MQDYHVTGCDWSCSEMSRMFVTKFMQSGCCCNGENQQPVDTGRWLDSVINAARHEPDEG